jgi:hypothetical protein
MTDGPTTMNGPLHTDEANLDDRAMVASFSTSAAALAAKQTLIDAGVASDRIDIVEHAAGSPEAQAVTSPADPGILGRLREAILPEDSERLTRAAVRNDDAVLTLRPLPSEVEMAVGVLKAAKPSHFDADLELWRNARS